MMKNQLDLLFEDVPLPGDKSVAVILGRFNPPTAGHYELVHRVKSFIKANAPLNIDSIPIVVIIGNDEKEKTDKELSRNPLSVQERITFMKASGSCDGVKFAHATNAFEALTGLRRNGLEPIAIAAGSDRIKDYLRILDHYFKDAADKPIKHYPIHVARDSTASDKPETDLDELLKVMRDGDDLKVDAISATLARRAAELGYLDEFTQIVGLSNKPILAKKLFDKVKKAIGGNNV